MQRGLIDHRAGEKRLAVVESREGQVFKPVGLPVIKVSLDANLVKSRLLIILNRCVCCTHSAPRAFSSLGMNLYVVAGVLFF